MAMKKFKDENNKVHDPEMDEAEGLAFLEKMHPNMTFTPISDAEFDILTAPIPLTPQEIEDNKTARAQELSSSPQMQAAIEEFVSVLQAASIPVPADIAGNIVNRCKAKL